MSNANYWQRQLSRRGALRGATLAGLGATGFALAGCSGGNKNNGNKSAAATTQATGQATAAGTSAPPLRLTPRPTASIDEARVPKDGVLQSRQGAPYASINPYKGLDSGLLWGYTIFDHLWFVPTDTGVRELFLASSIEQPDPLNFTAKIKDAFFHDKPPVNGRKVKAADIKASFEAAANAPQVSASPWWKQSLDSISTPDDSTVVFKLKQIDAWTFTSLNGGSPISSSIVPQEIAVQPDFMDKDLIGSGRYQFVSHENGTNFKIKRFDNWRIKGEPWTAGIQYKLLQEQAAALAAFSSQQIDAVTPSNKLERDALVQKHGKSIEVETQLSASVWTIQGRADGVWADPRVRQALYYAIDRDEYIQLMNFGDGRKSGPVPPAHGRYALDDAELDKTVFKFDPAEGKKLLAAAGFDLNKEYELKYYVPGDQPAQFAQITQSQLQKNLGLKTKLIGEDFGTWLAKSLYGSQYDGFMTYPSLAYDDPTGYIAAYQKTNGVRPNSARFMDDELDKLVNDQKAILDDDKRTEAIREIQRQSYVKAAPYIPVFSPITSPTTWGYVKNRVIGRGSFGLFNGRFYIDKSS